MYGRLLLLASALALTTVGAAHAQTNLDNLSSFQVTGTPLEMETIDQGGERAARLRRNLENIDLPPGFKIDLYAVVPDARHIAVAPQGTVAFVGTRDTHIWAVTDRDRNRVADEVKRFAPSIDFAIPNGVCFSKDGFLYTVEQNRVLVFPAAEDLFEGSDLAEGWLNQATGGYLGGPVDVAQLPDGSIIISDDFAGALYRIWYEG